MSLAIPAAPGRFSTPGGRAAINEASVRPNPPLNVTHPNRSRQMRSMSGGIGAAAHKRRRWPALLFVIGGVGNEDRERSEHRRDRRSAALDLGPEAGDREAPGDARGTTDGERAHHRDRDGVQVEQRKRGPHDVVGGALPRARDLLGHADDVVVAEHAPLRRSGRAGRVDEAREVGGRDLDRGQLDRQQADLRRGNELGVVVDGDRGDRRVGSADDDRGLEPGGVRRDLGDPAREVALHDDDARAGVGELMAEELALVGGVDRDRDGTQPQRREERDHLFGPVLEQARDAIAAADADARERGREPRGFVVDPACRVRVAHEVEVRPVGVGADSRRQLRVDRRAPRSRHRAEIRGEAARRAGRCSHRRTRSGCRAPTPASGRGARRPPT